jgi:hypothetical protein
MRLRALLAASAAALVLAAAAGTASARRLEFSEQHYRAIWANFVLFSEGTGPSFRISCAVTMEGSFHSKTISKVSGALIGYVTDIEVKHPCTGNGEAWALNGFEIRNGTRVGNTLPWHERYKSFTGVLPLIGGMKTSVVGQAFEIEKPSEFLSCLYQATAAQPAFYIDFFREQSQDEEGVEGIPLLSGIGCPPRLGAAGSGRLTNPAGGALSLRLVT